MKNLLALAILFLSFSLSAQNADSLKIKASDPTQIYSSVSLYGGLNFIDVSYGKAGIPDLDSWEFGFRGNWAMKKFRIGMYLPISNNAPINRILDDVTLDVGYQIHNNTGFYNTSVVNAGFTFASQEQSRVDWFFGYPNSKAAYKYFFSYLGALNFSDKIAFYPGVEWFTRTSQNDESTFFYDPNSGTFDSVYYGPMIVSPGWKFSGTLSYDINSRNFMQVFASWSTEKWNAKWGSSEKEMTYLNAIEEQQIHVSAKYQFAISQYHQLYFSLLYNKQIRNGLPYNQLLKGNLYSLQLGYIHFLH